MVLHVVLSDLNYSRACWELLLLTLKLFVYRYFAFIRYFQFNEFIAKCDTDEK